jgi:hypothetical protein
VSMSPRAWRRSGTRERALVEQRVYIRPETAEIDARSGGEDR